MTFAVKPTLPQNRLQLSFTLVLTAVAFKFVVNQSLPRISYLTYLVSAARRSVDHLHLVIIVNWSLAHLYLVTHETQRLIKTVKDGLKSS